MSEITEEEKASFKWGGTRARPRKGIVGASKKGETYLKPPGFRKKWPGLSFNVDIECCEDCTIYVLDSCAQVQISECTNCRVVVGPCVGSVFLLECVGCTFSIAAKQLRLRDVSESELRIFSPTADAVVVESCSKLTIRSWDVCYPGLAAQFAAAGWHGIANQWRRVYNFTPPTTGAPPSYELMPTEKQAKSRWTELKVEPEGLCGGTVIETSGNFPQIEGCECPCKAADGVGYQAPWFDSEAFSPPPPPSAPAAASAPPPAASGTAAFAALRSASSELWTWLSSLLANAHCSPRIQAGEAKNEPASAKGGESAKGDESTFCSVQ